MQKEYIAFVSINAFIMVAAIFYYIERKMRMEFAERVKN
jgi:hypothetical protein